MFLLKLFILTCGLLVFFGSAEATLDPKTICYYESWAYWRNGAGKMRPSDIDNSLCTHLVYAYLGVDPETHEITLPDPYVMKELNDLEQFTGAKGQAKALIAVGGTEQLSAGFPTIVSSENNRTTFVQNLAKFLDDHNLDGVVIQWHEMPIRYGPGLAALFEVFRQEKFTQRFILSLAVPSYTSGDTWAVDYAPTSYELNAYSTVLPERVAEYADFIIVLSYDLRPWWSLEHLAPLAWQWRDLLLYGRMAPRAKLVPTVPLFARSRTYLNVDHDHLHLTVHDQTRLRFVDGPAGPLSRTPGYLTFPEFCSQLNKAPADFYTYSGGADGYAATRSHAEKNETDYFTVETRASVAAKAQNFTSAGFGGVAVFALSADDWSGKESWKGGCGMGRYPLMHAIVAALNRTEVPEPTKQPTGITTPPAENPFSQVNVFHCQKEGRFGDPWDCSKIHICEKDELGALEDNVLHCPEGFQHRNYYNVTWCAPLPEECKIQPEKCRCPLPV